jgi:hypothetical protein
VPFDAGAVLDGLAALAEATTGVDRVYRGAPLSTEGRLVAGVSLGGADLLEPRRTGTVRRRLRYRVLLAYRVGEGDLAFDAERVEAAERAIAAALDDFLGRLYADLTLAQACDSAVQVDLSQADAPEYSSRAGQEDRVYPIVIGATQEAPFNPSP